MLNPKVFFQRTDQGVKELMSSKAQLNQSERLLLIMIDGVTSYEMLCSKLKGLASSRVEKGLVGLAKKGLITEVANQFLKMGDLPDLGEHTINLSFFEQNTGSQTTSITSLAPLSKRDLPASANLIGLSGVKKVKHVDFYLPLEPADRRLRNPVQATQELRLIELTNPNISRRKTDLRTPNSTKYFSGKYAGIGWWTLFILATLAVLVIVIDTTR